MNCITFFAGAGGLDMGIHRAGFDIRMSVEIEAKYCETLRANHPDWNVIQGDIMNYTKEMVLQDANMTLEEELDLIVGGSPCQSFSTSGKRRSFDDPRGMAMLKYAELVEELQPKVFLLENVKGLLSASLQHRPLNARGKDNAPLKDEEKPGSALAFLLSKFKSYTIDIHTVNAADYGVAQKRERVFIIGIRNDISRPFIFPLPTHGTSAPNLPPWKTVGDVLEYLQNRNTEHHYVKYSNERLKYMQMIPQGGGNWRNLPDEVAKAAMKGAYHSGGGKVGFFRRVKINDPSPTLLTSPHQNSTNLGHPLEDRPLSIEEYLCIQGFPLDYKIVGTLSNQYTQIGNAVPVELAYQIGLAIHEFLERECRETIK